MSGEVLWRAEFLAVNSLVNLRGKQTCQLSLRHEPLSSNSESVLSNASVSLGSKSFLTLHKLTYVNTVVSMLRKSPTLTFFSIFHYNGNVVWTVRLFTETEPHLLWVRLWWKAAEVDPEAVVTPAVSVPKPRSSKGNWKGMVTGTRPPSIPKGVTVWFVTDKGDVMRVRGEALANNDAPAVDCVETRGQNR